MANEVKVEIIENNSQIVLDEETINLIIGETGPQGVRGNTILNGSGGPNLYLGELGDFYIDTDTQEMYGPKTVSGWGTPVDLVTNQELGYIHTQAIPNAVWTITHNLGFMPNITVVDSFERVVEGSYVYLNEDTVQLTFDGAFSGKAYLS